MRSAYSDENDDEDDGDAVWHEHKGACPNDCFGEAPTDNGNEDDRDAAWYEQNIPDPDDEASRCPEVYDEDEYGEDVGWGDYLGDCGDEPDARELLTRWEEYPFCHGVDDSEESEWQNGEQSGWDEWGCDYGGVTRSSPRKKVNLGPQGGSRLMHLQQSVQAVTVALSAFFTQVLTEINRLASAVEELRAKLEQVEQRQFRTDVSQTGTRAPAAAAPQPIGVEDEIPF